MNRNTIYEYFDHALYRMEGDSLFKLDKNYAKVGRGLAPAPQAHIFR